MNLLQLRGYSGLYLKLEIAKKILGVIMLVVTVPMGLTEMCIGKVCLSLISIPLNTYYSGKFYNYGMLAQLKDLSPILILTLIMGGVIWVSVSLISSLLLKLILGFFVGVIFYVGGAYLFKFHELDDIFDLINSLYFL